MYRWQSILNLKATLPMIPDFKAEYLDPNKGMYQTISTTGVIQCHEDTPEDAILFHTES